MSVQSEAGPRSGFPTTPGEGEGGADRRALVTPLNRTNSSPIRSVLLLPERNSGIARIISVGSFTTISLSSILMGAAMVKESFIFNITGIYPGFIISGRRRNTNFH